MRHFHLAPVVLMLTASLSGCKQSDEETPVKNQVDNGQQGVSSHDTHSDSATDNLAESQLLKEELVRSVSELMQLASPDQAPEVIRAQAENAIDKEIQSTRKVFPNFLMLTKEAETTLSKGESLPDVSERITEAEQSIGQSWPQAGLVSEWLPKHKDGTLSPIRTEILAQIMTGQAMGRQAALGN